MGVFSLKLYFEDVWQQLRCNRRRVLVCILCAVLGIVLGIVLFNTANYNMWYCNRWNFACKLLDGGFFEIFLSFALGAALCSLLLCLFSLWYWTPLLCYPLLVVISLYFGANCAALFACAGMVGILYIIFVLIVGQLVNMLCCFLTLCQPPCCKTFREAAAALTGVFLFQFACAILKIVVIFFLLRFIFGTI